MLDICNVCKKWKTVHRSRKTKKLICPSCYDKDRYHDPSKREQCSRCKEVKQVRKRTEDGPICSNCHNKSRVGCCNQCKKTKIITTSHPPLCWVCYQRQRRAKIATTH